MHFLYRPYNPLFQILRLYKFTAVTTYCSQKQLDRHIYLIATSFLVNKNEYTRYDM